MSWPPTSASLMVPPPIDGVATERHIVKPRIQGTYTAELKESPSGPVSPPPRAHRFQPSAGDHAHEDAILAHEMMVERRTDMRGRKPGDGGTYQAVNEKQLFGQCAVLRPDRREIEQAENRYRRAISRSGDPTAERLHDQEGVESPVRHVCGKPLDRRNVVG
jgi:hypothetical protein